VDAVWDVVENFSSSFNMEATCAFWALVPLYQTTWHIPENCNLEICCCENFMSQNYMGGGWIFADLLSSWITAVLPFVASLTMEFNSEHKKGCWSTSFI
jgi:hypothetical protein